MKLKTLALTTTMAVSALAASGAMAYEAGDIILRAGAVTVSPDESSDGIGVPALGIDPINGTEAEVDSNTQLGLTATYMFSSSLGVELLAATPFSHDITANLDGYASGLSVAAGDTKHLPPTVSVVYYPFSSDNASAFKPYVGLGINYTAFFEEDASSDLEALTGDLAGAGGPVPLSLKLDDSVGLALQVGADYSLNDQWHINASVRWIDINTDAKFSNADLGTVITVNDVEIDPWVYQINLGYKF